MSNIKRLPLFPSEVVGFLFPPEPWGAAREDHCRFLLLSPLQTVCSVFSRNPNNPLGLHAVGKHKLTSAAVRAPAARQIPRHARPWYTLDWRAVPSDAPPRLRFVCVCIKTLPDCGSTCQICSFSTDQAGHY